jgi:class 3 adenylate cyclase
MERKLTAILCADVAGYSRLMGEDEEATFRTLPNHRSSLTTGLSGAAADINRVGFVTADGHRRAE